MSTTFEGFIDRLSDVAIGTQEQNERHDDLLAIIENLDEEGRQKLVAYLTAHIRAGDLQAVAIARDASVIEVVPVLEEKLYSSNGPLKVAIVDALDLIGAVKGLEDYLIEAVKEGANLEAVKALSAYRGDKVVEALIAALDDTHQVRFAAAEALLPAAGIERTDEEGFGRLDALIESNHRVMRAVGIDWFRQIQRSKQAGADYGEYAKELIQQERSTAFEAFFETYNERPVDDEALPDDEKALLLRLDEDERFWVEYGFLRDVLEGTSKAFPCLEVVAGSLTRAVVAKCKERSTAEEPVAKAPLIDRLIERFSR